MNAIHPALRSVNANRMAWTGSRMIDVLNPAPEDIILAEIAIGLSREFRYAGNATSIPWSVGQHSLLAYGFAREDGIVDPRTLAVILLHDAPEYMIRDLIRPVKQLCPDYQALEDNWWAAIAAKFRLPYRMPEIVTYYDDVACSSEKAALISPRAGKWPGLPEPREIPEKLLTPTLNEVRVQFEKEASALLTLF